MYLEAQGTVCLRLICQIVRLFSVGKWRAVTDVYTPGHESPKRFLLAYLELDQTDRYL